MKNPSQFLDSGPGEGDGDPYRDPNDLTFKNTHVLKVLKGIDHATPPWSSQKFYKVSRKGIIRILQMREEVENLNDSVKTLQLRHRCEP